jgi:hypothetical protein
MLWESWGLTERSAVAVSGKLALLSSEVVGSMAGKLNLVLGRGTGVFCPESLLLELLVLGSGTGKALTGVTGDSDDVGLTTTWLWLLLLLVTLRSTGRKSFCEMFWPPPFKIAIQLVFDGSE